MCFKIDWASLIVGSKFTIFALFYFVSEGNFPSTSPQGGLYLEGRFNGRFFALPVWGAYIWRGLYMEGLIFGILRYASHNNYFPGITIPGNISGHLQYRPDLLEDPGFKTMVGQRITSGQDDYLSTQTFACRSF